MEKQIEYKADTHEYLYDGEKFNSVTELATLYSKKILIEESILTHLFSFWLF